MINLILHLNKITITKNKIKNSLDKHLNTTHINVFQYVSTLLSKTHFLMPNPHCKRICKHVKGLSSG